jgi:hypothetical protein
MAGRILSQRRDEYIVEVPCETRDEHFRKTVAFTRFPEIEAALPNIRVTRHFPDG